MRTSFAIAGVVLSCCVSLASTAFAEEPGQKAVVAYVKAEIDRRFLSSPEARMAFRKWQTFFTQAMQLHVNEIVADCELNSEQETRLATAAKGTVEQYVHDWLTWVAIQRTIMHKADEKSPLADALLDGNDFEDMSRLVGTWPVVRILRRQSVWQKALESTLTQKQLDVVRQEAKDRDANQLTITSNWVMGRLDDTLLLSKAQKLRLEPLIRKQLSEMANPETAVICGQFFTLAWAYQTSPADVSTILSESQTQLWNARKQVFDELGDEWEDAFRISDWFDPTSLEEDAIRLVVGQQTK